MHQYVNEESAWLRLQDMQREAENRRQAGGERPSAMMQAMRRLLARSGRKRTTARNRPAGA
jgi:hypothetical protein